MGIGYVVAINPGDVDLAKSLAPSALEIGQVVAGESDRAPRVIGLGNNVP